MGLILSSTLDLYRLVRVSLFSVIDERINAKTFTQRVADAVSTRANAFVASLAPAYATA